MARIASKEERIRFKLHDNLNDPSCTSFERTVEYCEAFVEGEMAIEKEVSRMQIGMTRKEAIQRIYELNTSLKSEEFVRVLELLGFRFKPEPEVKALFKADLTKWGTIKIEEWPEGLVVWAGGRIRYKSWVEQEQYL